MKITLFSSLFCFMLMPTLFAQSHNSNASPSEVYLVTNHALLQLSEQAHTPMDLRSFSANSIVDQQIWARRAERSFMAMDFETNEKSGLLGAISSHPGAGFFASLIVPGLGQAANDQLWKTGVLLAVEAASIYFIIDGNKRGRDLEREYIADGNRQWSVVQYASWVHEYYHTVPNARVTGAPDVLLSSLLTPAGQAYANQNGLQFPNAQFGDTTVEWDWIDLQALRSLERSTHYLRTNGTRGNAFSHDVPNFGSQQYYELMSKYWQFGPGWQDWKPFTNGDFNTQVATLNALSNDAMNPQWLAHTRLEEQFNDAFRFAGNMTALLVVNHFVSAFDAYFTIKLRNHRLESEMMFTPIGGQYKMTWHF